MGPSAILSESPVKQAEPQDSSITSRASENNFLKAIDAQHFLRVEMLLLEKLVHLYIYAQVQGNFHDGHTWRTRQAMFLVLILSLTN